MTLKPRHWTLAEAQATATRLRDLLAPACHRIEIAGSIRRLKPSIGDVELLAIPKETPPKANLFGEPIPQDGDQLDDAVRQCILVGLLDYRATKNASRVYGPMNKLLLDTQTGMGLDLFTTTAENWGMAWMVRTGSAEWNIRFMARLRALGLRGHAYGGITIPGSMPYPSSQRTEVQCPDEATVFEYLRWPWREPRERK